MEAILFFNRYIAGVLVMLGFFIAMIRDSVVETGELPHHSIIIFMLLMLSLAGLL